MSFFSLKQEERLSTSETLIKDKFYHHDNITRVHLAVHRQINNSYSQGDVVDVMHSVFTQALGENFNMKFETGVVDRLNAKVVERIRALKSASDKALLTSRRVGFETSKIPATFLPRASFSVEKDSFEDSFEFI